MNTISLIDINKSFGDVRALDSVSLDVKEGEIFGIIGPDGAGKTTLFRIITSLMLFDSGEANVLGYNVVKDYKKVRKEIGYMPGRFSLYQDLSVEENLKFYATIFGHTVEENYHLIKDIYSHIEPFKKRRAGKLSGGMKQKLALSCALIHEPKLLVLDEPTTGVDAVSRREFWEMLQNLKKSGMTILVSTPYMDEASQCDRIALMNNGKILANDTPDGISASFTKPLFAIRGEKLYAILQFLVSSEITHSAFPFGQVIHFVPKDTEMTVQEIRSEIEKSTNEIVEVGETVAGIEDCFMEMMTQDEE